MTAVENCSFKVVLQKKRDIVSRLSNMLIYYAYIYIYGSWGYDPKYVEGKPVSTFCAFWIVVLLSTEELKSLQILLAKGASLVNSVHIASQHKNVSSKITQNEKIPRRKKGIAKTMLISYSSWIIQVSSQNQAIPMCGCYNVKQAVWWMHTVLYHSV